MMSDGVKDLLKFAAGCHALICVVIILWSVGKLLTM